MPTAKKAPPRKSALLHRPARKLASEAQDRRERFTDYIAVRMTADERAFVDKMGGSAYVRELIAKARKREEAKS